MNGNKYIIDTNIILYILGGNKKLAEMLNNKKIHISFITELELLGYKKITEKDKIIIKDFLSNCNIIDINSQIKEYTLQIKQKQLVRLPDAIIGATALFLNIPLLTSDKGFEKIKEIDLHIFEY